MGTRCGIVCVAVILLQVASAQLPSRLQIPGAVLLPGSRPSPIRRINPDGGPRPRRPIPNASPASIRDVRPVIEEEEDPTPLTSAFDDEVNKLGISALTSAVRQAVSDEEDEPTIRPSPLPFRPERPRPLGEGPKPSPLPLPRPVPVPRPFPVQQIRPSAPPRPIRPVVRQEIDDGDDDLNIRQPVRQKARQQISPQIAQQQFRPAPPPPRPRPQQFEDEGSRKRKPPVQILRKYRTDNPDGSITWGFENEDGTFKEETLGTDCITRGKYGYFDPDGVKREYTYETGNKCDPQDLPYEEEEEVAPNVPLKRPANAGKPLHQFRP